MMYTSEQSAKPKIEVRRHLSMAPHSIISQIRLFASLFHFFFSSAPLSCPVVITLRSDLAKLFYSSFLTLPSPRRAVRASYEMCAQLMYKMKGINDENTTANKRNVSPKIKNAKQKKMEKYSISGVWRCI